MEKRKEKKSLEERASKILAEIDQHRKEAQKRKMNFTAVTKEELYNKLTKKNSPMIIAQVWGSTPPGGSIKYTVQIHNPDPYTVAAMFCHVFFGPGNIVPDVGLALCSIDTRFPRLTLPKVVGLHVDPDTSKDLDFEIPIPMGIEPSNYIGNCFLFQAKWHETGVYLDRAVFIVQVT